MNKSYRLCGVCGKCYGLPWVGASRFLHHLRQAVFESTLHYRNKER